MSRIKSEDTRWVKRFKDATRSLDALKREIQDQNLATALNVYLQKKDLELENSKMQMKSSHVNKINMVYQIETENWTNIVMKASEIIQDNFLLLRSLNELDNTMEEKLKLLGKMLQGQRNVKFVDEGSSNLASAVHADADSNECLTFQNILNLTDLGDESGTQSPMVPKKRLNEIDEDEKDTKKSKNSSAEDFQFLRPKAMKSINFESASILKTRNNDHDLNMTFDLNDAGGGATKTLLDRGNKPFVAASSSSSKGKIYDKTTTLS